MTTLKEQEKHERVNKKGDKTTTNGAVDDDSITATDKEGDAVDDDAGEIAALDEEAEMPLEELIKLYGGAFTEEAVEDDSFIKLAKKGNGKNCLCL